MNKIEELLCDAFFAGHNLAIARGISNNNNYSVDDKFREWIGKYEFTTLQTLKTSGTEAGQEAEQLQQLKAEIAVIQKSMSYIKQDGLYLVGKYDMNRLRQLSAV